MEDKYGKRSVRLKPVPKFRWYLLVY
jgi:hypothetical protein